MGAAKARIATMAVRSSIVAILSTLALAGAISVGDKLPSVEMHDGFPGAGGKAIDIAEYVAGKKVLLVGLPGAFTPT